MKSKILIFVLLLIWTYSFAQIKVACIGNSITYGGGDSSAYPQQMGKMLGKDWLVKNFGVNGATMLKKGDKPYWEQPDFKMAKEFLPDVVIIKLGTNDSKPQNWNKYKEEYEKDYMDMIETFLKLKSHPKIWLGIPTPVIEEKWGIKKKIVENEMPTIIIRLAKKYKLGFIDFYSNLIKKPRLFPDGIHPNAEGNKIMAETASKVMKDNQNNIISRKK